MPAQLTIALAQCNPTVGDLDGNLALIEGLWAEAAEAGADLVVFPELVLTGYPLEDLVLKPALLERSAALLDRLAAATAKGGPAILLGAPWAEGKERPYNGAFLLAGGEIKGRRAKHELPNYGVFDEKRVFAAGPVPGPLRLDLLDGGLVRIGAMVCEDMWVPDVAEGLEESGAELLLVINGSPFEAGKQDTRLQHAVARVTETGLPLLYLNLVGGQDELVFDGASFVLDADRRLVAQAAWFEPALLLTTWTHDDRGWQPMGDRQLTRPPEELEAIYRAMVLGLRDYVHKNGFPGVVLGLSGGVDSGLSAAVAADALGPERVHALMMPSRYTSTDSLEDAWESADLLGIQLDTVEIEPAFEAFKTVLAPLFGDRPPDITEENIQSRIRGMILMAVSNKLGSMVLTTGNKSEMSVGYATLYGDMCGGYSVLKDVYKTTVFALCHYRNANRPKGCLGPAGMAIPLRTIEKPPTAELREGQKDEDSLPPYPLLDAILQGLVEDDRSAAELVATGHSEAAVRQVSNLLDIAEYKRRQAPPGVKITAKAFGRDRRYPITNHFRRLGLHKP